MSSLNYRLNCVNISLCSLTKRHGIKSLPINSIYVKNFHTKSDISKERHRAFRHNRKNPNDEDSNVFSYFIKLSSVTIFVFSAFALTELWKSIVGSITKFVDSLQGQEMGRRNSSLSFFVGATALILGANVATFMLWQSANLRNTMMKYTTVSRSAGITQMLFAAFSHANFLHCFINLYVLTSFIRAWERYASMQHSMPQDLMSADKFLAFYLSAGVVASAGSCIIQNIGKHSFRSLGASGAVLALVGYICYKVPEGKLSIAFLPQFSFSAKNGLIGMAAFDTAGLLLGIVTKWKYTFIDHAAHLTGLAFGLWYAKYGEVLLYRWSDYCKRKISERKR